MASEHVHLVFILFVFLGLTFTPTQIFSTEFIYNTNFNSTNILKYGSAAIDEQTSILSLTNDTTFTIGRVLYPFTIPTKQEPNFSTSFIFSMAPYKNKLAGHGFAFLFVPFTGIRGSSSSQHLGLFNFTNDGNPENHVFAVEFDVFDNEELDDINGNHVGLDVNSLKSVISHAAGFWDIDRGGDEEFKELTLNNGANYQVWIDYLDSRVNVTMVKTGSPRPSRPLISEFLNLTGVLLDDMYVGFTGATGALVQSHRILAWSFSSSNFSMGDALIATGLPSFLPPEESIIHSKVFIVSIAVAAVLLMCGIGAYVFVIWRMRRKAKEKGGSEEWELDYWPHRIDYQELSSATEGFSDENVIGIGGNGKVYKGVLAGGDEVAVKRIAHENEQAMKEFLAEVSSLGRLRHRNLVGLRGWCIREKGSLILVYEYMENRSLDKRLFECDERLLLSWEERIKILRDVASGILYLHEGWEAKVLHRDIKASNVLLDKDMNARLGDFGLARMHNHSQLATTTRVVGTVGYMAPEIIKTGRAATQTDVFSFGVLIFEVVCGRRPVEEGKPGLVKWVWRLMENGRLIDAVDERLNGKHEYKAVEVERILHLGLLCTYPDPLIRPSMRQVLEIFEQRNEEGIELDPNSMEVKLLDSIRSHNHLNSGGSAHPTFDDLQRHLSYSISIASDTIREGR